MMKCSKIKKLLPDYLEQVLDSKLQLYIKSHIKQCPKCTQELLFLERYLKEIKKIKKAPAPDNFIEKIKTRIQEPFSLIKIIKKIMIPVKLPFELTGAVIAIIILTILFIPKDGLKETSNEVNLLRQKQAQIINENKKLKIGNASKTASRSKRDKPLEENGIINLVVNIFPTPYQEEWSKDEEKIKSKTLSGSDSMPSYGTTKKESNAGMAFDNKNIRQGYSLSNANVQIRHIINNLNGIILHEPKRQILKNTQSILLQLPQTNYDTFISQINQQFQNNIQKQTIPNKKLKNVKIQLDLQSK